MNTKPPPGYRYYHIVAIVFVATLIIANTISVKVIDWAGFTLPAGIIVFPVSYIFGDILTEVYGFRRARSVIWWGFFSLALMSFFYWASTLLQPASFWGDDAAYGKFFGLVPRINFSSFLAFLIGEYFNSMVLSYMKVRMNGRHLWMRAVASTIVGQIVDSIVFNGCAFGGIIPLSNLLWIGFSGFVLKVAYEIIALPLTYAICAYLKKAEQVDVYDVDEKYRLVN